MDPRAPLPSSDFLDREVSCGVFRGLLEAAERDGLPLTDLVAGTGYDVEHYLDPTNRVNWAALQTISERAGVRWTTEELRAIGASSLATDHFEPVVFLARLLLKPTEAYSFIIRGDSDGDFACVGAVTEVDGQHVRVTATIAPGYGHAPAFFEVVAGAAESVPTLFGLEPATAVVEITERGAIYDIEVPPGGGRTWIDRFRPR